MRVEREIHLVGAPITMDAFAVIGDLYRAKEPNQCSSGETR
jgi:hypothetical protein